MSNDYNFKLWCSKRIVTNVERAFIAYLKEQQDLKNNPRLNCKYFNRGLNMNTSAFKGFSSRGGKSKKCRWI